MSGPFFAYPQRAPVVRGESCPSPGASAISGIAFDAGTSFPAPLDGALFFADYIRGCIWAFPPRRFGAPHLGSLRVFETQSQFPVDLVKGPDGLYYANIVGGTVQRIAYERPTIETVLRTRPRGLSLGFDGRTERDGTSITIRPGSEHRLSAAGRIRGRGKRLRFTRWADGGQRVRHVSPGKGTHLHRDLPAPLRLLLVGTPDLYSPAGIINPNHQGRHLAGPRRKPSNPRSSEATATEGKTNT